MLQIFVLTKVYLLSCLAYYPKIHWGCQLKLYDFLPKNYVFIGSLSLLKLVLLQLRYSYQEEKQAIMYFTCIYIYVYIYIYIYIILYIDIYILYIIYTYFSDINNCYFIILFFKFHPVMNVYEWWKIVRGSWNACGWFKQMLRATSEYKTTILGPY